jgi:signal transduction histidine kinase
MKEKLLLVDDEPGILKVLGISLEDLGYHVFTAQNGDEALQIFRRHRPRIILTDIKMPGMDGIQLLQEIKKDGPDAEVIMITGHGDMELAIQSLKFEASDFITKPISDEALAIALKRAKERMSYKARLKEYTENLENLVEEKTRKLVGAERMAVVGQTVAVLAHAIKNITAGLGGGMFVLKKGIELDDRKYLSQGFEMVEGNVGKIKDMAMDLLNFCKDREPENQLCDPNKPAREVYGLMRPLAEEKGVTLRAQFGERLPKAWLDSGCIHRALLNLVSNAIDACLDLSCTGKTREVVLRCVRPEGWSVEYQVEDNGCGMDEETRSRIFQSFFSTKGSKGTGLGLMITKKIVDEQGGIIEVKSEEAKGTKFCIKLPERDHP